jgi:hypothetical protein
MPMISRCRMPGCSTTGMGDYCIAHTPKPDRTFVRGRPWPPPQPEISGNDPRVLSAERRMTVPAASSR